MQLTWPGHLQGGFIRRFMSSRNMQRIIMGSQGQLYVGVESCLISPDLGPHPSCHDLSVRPFLSFPTQTVLCHSTRDLVTDASTHLHCWRRSETSFFIPFLGRCPLQASHFGHMVVPLRFWQSSSKPHGQNGAGIIFHKKEWVVFQKDIQQRFPSHHL